MSDVNSIKIDALIKNIENGEIKIPPLQRSFVWKKDQIVQLLESIYNDYPIGSILLWETTDTPLSASRSIAGFKLPKREPGYPYNYVLDGQQRLSSIYGVFCKNRVIDTKTDRDYKIDHSIFEILFDIEKRIFISTEEKIKGKRYITLKHLLNPTEFIKEIQKFSDEEREFAVEFQSKFNNYSIPVVTTKKRTLEEVGVIFERVNNTGTKLDLFDLMAAITWAQDFHLRAEFSKIHKKLSSKGFGNIKNKVLLQCLSGIIKRSSNIKVITSLEPKSVRQKLPLLKASLEKTVDYLSTELEIKSGDFLPHAHQLVALTYFFSTNHIPTKKQSDLIYQWFWKTAFSRRYSASTDRHIDEDINAFHRLSGSTKNNPFKNYNYTITTEELKAAKFSKNSPTSRAMIVLMANMKPLNLLTGTKIDTGEALSKFNRREFHHIFPKNYLQNKGEDASDINSIVNICFIPANTNKKISDRPPSEYFKDIPKNKRKIILSSNLIPLKDELYSKNAFTKFLDERAKNLITELDNKIS